MSRIVRWARVVAGVLIALGLILFVWGEVLKRRDYLPYFQSRKSELQAASEILLEQKDTTAIYRLELRSADGLVVDGHLQVPLAVDDKKLPVILILGGLHTGKSTLTYLPPSRDMMLLALDYPYHGKKRGLSMREFVVGLPEIRQAMLDSVPASMLALDYLWTRPDVDRERVLLAGGSFGALFSPAVAAADPRVSALAVFFGAGDLPALVRTHLDVPWPLRLPLSWLGGVIVSPMEPLKYIHHVAPRPIFMLNGTEDSSMPERYARLLHDRAGVPKTIHWIPLGHVDIRSTALHREILDHFLRWLVAIDFLTDEEAAALTSSTKLP